MVWLRGGTTGEGLRSVGVAPKSPIQERVLYPARRSLFIGPGSLGRFTRPFALPRPDKPCSYQDDRVRVILRGVPAFIMLALLAALFPTQAHYLSLLPITRPSLCPHPDKPCSYQDDQG